MIYNDDAINQSLVQSALIESKLAQANAQLAVQLEKVADSYIDLLLAGGNLNFLGATYQRARPARRRSGCSRRHAPTATRLAAARRELAAGRGFAQIAVENLGGSKAVIGAVAAPIVVTQQVRLGRRTPLDYYARRRRGVGPDVRLPAARLRHARARTRGEHVRAAAARPGPAAALLGEKALLAAHLRVRASAFAMLAGIGIFVPLDWGAAGLWLVALVGAALAFATLGVALGGLVRDVRAASLLALLVSAPAGLPRARPGAARSPAGSST